jgi:hypothetical protein
VVAGDKKSDKMRLNKQIILLVILISAFSSFGQKADPKKVSKEQTQKFIRETIKEHSYCSKEDGIKNKFLISFNDSLMIINNLKGSSTYFTTFKVRDIDTLSVEEKDFNVWLVILLKPGKQETTIINSKPMQKPLGLYEILLNKTFLKDSLPVKIGDAFNNLVRFYD